MVVTAPVNNIGKGKSTRLAVAAHIHTFPEQTRGVGGGGAGAVGGGGGGTGHLAPTVSRDKDLVLVLLNV